MNFLLVSLTAATTTTDSTTSNWTWLIFPVVMFVALYFLAIRPQKKKEKEAAKMRNSVDVGDTITTIGGITGRVIGVKDEAEEIVIETGASNTKIRIKKWAIATRESYDDIDDDKKAEKTAE